jgi:hypothetical protein
MNQVESLMVKKSNAERLVYGVPEAGRKLGLGKFASYAAAARGEIPVIKIGKFLRVPKAAFDRMLDQAVCANAGGSKARRA